LVTYYKKGMKIGGYEIPCYGSSGFPGWHFRYRHPYYPIIFLFLVLHKAHAYPGDIPNFSKSGEEIHTTFRASLRRPCFLYGPQYSPETERVSCCTGFTALKDEIPSGMPEVNSL
jgi:hypothetical protein